MLSNLRKLFIKTYGCQMNFYDSEKMVELLRPHGFTITESASDADLFILNTCHVRENPTEKVYAELGRIRKIKETRKKKGDDVVIAVAGCVAQAEGEEIFKRAKFVDVVVGPQSYHHLPVLIEQARREKKWAINLDFLENVKFDSVKQLGEQTTCNVSSFLSIQEGCDKFCHFCVVPYTRGPEYSRPVHEIYREALNLVSRSTKEITLLGQNVSAYKGTAPEDRLFSIADLIEHIAKIDGLERIRYTTSHPRDMEDNKLFELHASESKLMPFIHLPVQSGSDKIFRTMNRKHDRKLYVDVISRFRKANSNIQFSSDFIVGYPGETEQDFLETISLVEEIGYTQYFAFKYSRRPGTPASILENQISEEVKNERLARLQEVLNRQQLDFNRSMIGNSLDILIYKNGKKDGQLLGKSPYMQSVIIDDCNADLMNKMVKVKIISASQNSLVGMI